MDLETILGTLVQGSRTLNRTLFCAGVSICGVKSRYKIYNILIHIIHVWLMFIFSLGMFKHRVAVYINGPLCSIFRVFISRNSML